MTDARPESLEQAADDIRTMRVRGAGALARHAAHGLAAWEAALGARVDAPAFEAGFKDAVARLLATRPSAVSLRNGLRFVQTRVAERDDVAGKRRALADAVAEFDRRSREATAAIGRHARALVESGGTYLTHCNSQAALAGFFLAKAEGVDFEVIATETRPWRQGFLTSRQLAEAGIPVTLVVDSAAHQLLPEVDGVFTGCDTVTANGDVVNKVGTRGLALAARHEGVPFRVCGESFKVAVDVPSGDAVEIEERAHAEVAKPGEIAAGVRVLNPVFDVTPRDLVTAVITENGVAAPDEAARVARKAWGV